jgi:glycosyltransferase involved in cell wall biosynthesis
MVVETQEDRKREVASVEMSFVLPCLNEALTIGACVGECLSAIRESGTAGEVVIADNGSTDGSQEIATRAGARVVSVSRRGYGSALMAGIQAAQGKYVLMGDSDSSYDFTQMPRFLEKLRQGYDLVMGCRMERGGGTILPGAMPPLHRWLGNPVLSGLGRFFFHINITDFHCGIRAFNRARLLALQLWTPGMEFASEMIVKAALARFKLAEVPVTLRPDGRNRPPHLKTWRDGWRHLRFMLLHAPRWLFLYPGLTLMTFALVAFTVLLFGPLSVGGVRFDTNTWLVTAMGILVGFQIALFGLFSEVFCRTSGLLPPGKLAIGILRIEPFEKGLLLGATLFMTGAICLLIALAKWKAAGFGDLSYPGTLRWVIPSVTGMSLGIQVVFGGFLLAVLGLKVESRQGGGSTSITLTP